MNIEIDYLGLGLATLLALLFYAGYFYSKKYQEPSLNYSSSDFSNQAELKVKLNSAIKWIPCVILGTLLVALADPHFFVSKAPGEGGNKEHIPTEGISIYLLLDQSGSMAEKVSATLNGSRVEIEKETLLKQVTKDFIEKRPDDLMGLVSFARTPQILSPLTLDHKALLDQINKIQVVKNKDDDGTAMGYAIFKTVNMMAATKHYAEDLKKAGNPSYAIKSSVIIVVTDGLQDPSILDKNSVLRNISLEQAAQAAKANGIELYIINIDPNTYSAALTPQRNQMESITQLTGGKLYIVNDPGDVSQIFASINELKKSEIPQNLLSKENQPDLYKRISFYPYLIAFAIGLLLLMTLLNTLFLKKVP